MELPPPASKNDINEKSIENNQNLINNIANFFTLLPSATAQSNPITITTINDTKIISIDAELKKGKKYIISYKFKAPDTSPEFYLLGKLQIGSWEEFRNWQIASDAPGNLDATTLTLGATSINAGSSTTSTIAPSCDAGKDCDATTASGGFLRLYYISGACASVEPCDSTYTCGGSAAPTCSGTLTTTSTTEFSLGSAYSGCVASADCSELETLTANTPGTWCLAATALEISGADTYCVSSETEVTVNDITKPRINGSLDDSTPYQGQSVNMIANVTDETALSFCRFLVNDTLDGTFIILNVSVSGTNAQCAQNFTITLPINSVLNFTVIVNDTGNNLNQTQQIITVVETPSLFVNISLPLNNTEITANTTFTLIANITCLNNDCGTVSGLARYNDSGSNVANLAINTTKGAVPLFVNGSLINANSSYNFGGVEYPAAITESNATWGYDTTNKPSLRLVSETEFGAGTAAQNAQNNYTNISSLDEVFARYAEGPPGTRYAAHKFTFKINESESSVSKLTIFWNGTGGTQGSPPVLYANLSIWNSNDWEVLGNCSRGLDINPDGHPGCVINKTITNNIENYINETDNNAVYILALSQSAAGGASTSIIRTNYIELNVTTTANNPLSCGNMLQNNKCQLNWTINASGNVGSNLVIDVNFSSSLAGVKANDTQDQLIRIVAPDKTPPAFSNRQPINDTQIFNSGLIQFNITITEASEGIVSNANITELWTNCSLSGGVSTGAWTLNQTDNWTNAGKHAFNATDFGSSLTFCYWAVFANDSLGNFNWTQNFSIKLNQVIPDTTPPVVNTTLNKSYTNIVFGDIINLTANITDETGLSFCQIIINQSGPNNLHYENISLSGATTAQCSNVSAVILYGGNVINYTIRVNDTSDNWRTNDTIITVVDNIAPVVNTTLNKSYTNIVFGDVINLTANITDETGLSFCQIIINQSGPNAIEIINISLSGTSGQCYNVSEVTLAAGGVINYTIRANDTRGNFRTNDTIITVADIIIPVINGTLNKSLASIYLNDVINASFNVTDEVSLSTGQIIINDTGEKRYYNFTNIDGQTSGTFSQNFTVSCEDCVVNVTGWVNDTYGNIQLNDTVFTVPKSLSVNISLPLNNTKVPQYSLFTLTANVTCMSPSCGSVKGLARYNDSTSNVANKSISEIKGVTPLFIINSSDGTQIWSYVADLGTSDVARGVAVDSQDNIIVVGYETNTDNDWNVTKLDSNGNLLWSYVADLGTSDQPGGVAVDSQDNIIVVGYKGKPGPNLDWNVTKLDSNGNLLWSYVANSGTSDVAHGVAVDSQDNIIVVGHEQNTDVDWNVTKLDSNGNQLWSYVADLGTSDVARGVAVDSQDNIIVVGDEQNTDIDWNVTKLDSNGNLLWSYVADLGIDDIAYGVAVDSQDNIIVVGQERNTGGNDWNVTKLDSNGNLLWSYVANLGSSDAAYGVAVDSQDNIIVVGQEQNTDGDWNVTKLDSNGNQLWSYVADLGSSDAAYGVAVDSQDNIIVVGQEQNTDGDWNVTKLSGGENPLSCGFMVVNQECQLNFTINASGNVGSVLALDVNFTSTISNIISRDTQDHLIEITDTTPPIVNTTLNKSYTNIVFGDVINLTANITDEVGLSFCQIIINQSGPNNLEIINVSLSGTTGQCYNVSTITLSAGNVINYTIRVNDTSNNFKTNDTVITVVAPNVAPTANILECNNASIWSTCGNFNFRDNLTALRLNCTDSDGIVANVTFNFSNVDDSKTFFRLNATYNESDYWILNNTDETINDSGTFNVTALCYDDELSTDLNFTSFTIPFGAFNISFASPTGNTDMQQNQLTDFTVKIECIGGECGSINATLDPFAGLESQDLQEEIIEDENKISSTKESARKFLSLIRDFLAEIAIFSFFPEKFI